MNEPAPAKRRMTLIEWYVVRFAGLVKLPSIVSLPLQALLWLLYGYVWIPCWYLFDDKRPREENSAAQTGSRLSFSQWYGRLFARLAALPVLISLILELTVWLFYGFLWLPAAYFIQSLSPQRSAMAESPPLTAAPQAGELNRQPPRPTVRPATNSPALPPKSPAAAPPPPPQPSPPPGPAAHEPPGAPLDVNRASEQQIAALPGVGPILAKKAIGIRQTQPFASLETFASALQLSPHVAERLRSLTVFGAVQTPAAPARPAGRVVDF